MRIESTMSDQLVRYLDLVTGQAKLTAQNMANVDTPGYHALGIEFETEMQSALHHAAAGQDAQPVHVRFEDGLVARPDGNNVSMDRESLNLAEQQLKYRTGIALLKQQYQMTMDAIRADSGK
ncbi:MAG TPA: flagellar basal body rod protein FlgB [Terracidiphilus sp.]